MAVYVDNMQAKYGRMIMSHMIADTDEELHAMADRIGVARRWWQSPAISSGSHYDICASSRIKALRYGAIEITTRQAAAMNLRRRLTDVLGSPSDALVWFAEHRRAKKAAIA